MKFMYSLKIFILSVFILPHFFVYGNSDESKEIETFNVVKEQIYQTLKYGDIKEFEKVISENSDLLSKDHIKPLLQEFVESDEFLKLTVDGRANSPTGRGLYTTRSNFIAAVYGLGAFVSATLVFGPYIDFEGFLGMSGNLAIFSEAGVLTMLTLVPIYNSSSLHTFLKRAFIDRNILPKLSSDLKQVDHINQFKKVNDFYKDKRQKCKATFASS